MGFALGAVALVVVEVVRRMILAIETSVEQVGVALADHRGVVAEASLASDKRHAESLTPMIGFVLEQASLAASDLSAIAVDIGPGLFTGMRVGIAAAQALAWALDIPVAPVCSLDALALGVAPVDDQPGDTVVTALDARRGEVYWCVHKPRPSGAGFVRVTDPVVSTPEDLAVHLAERAEPVLCVGTGIERHRDIFEAVVYARCADADLRFPQVSAVARLGRAMVSTDSVVAAHAVAPMYLRAPDAEINWLTRDGAR